MPTRVSSPSERKGTKTPASPPGSAIAKRWRSGMVNKPKRLPDKKEAEVVGVFKACGGNHVAAAAVGISPRKLEYLFAAYPEFKEKCDEAREFAVEHAIVTIYKMGVVSKNIAALIFFLKNKAGWSDRREISGSIDVNVLPRIIEASYTIEATRVLPDG